MCGRYKQLNALQSFLELYGLAGAALDAPAAAFSGAAVAPGQKAPVFRQSGSATALCLLDWGFVPHWSKEDIGTKIINARAETLAEKPSFRQSLRTRRCIIPMAGFFEWDRSQKPVQAYDIHLSTAAPLAVAGLWDSWANPQDGSIKESFAIITTAAVAPVAQIHDRMPVILPDAAACARWLSPATGAAALQQLLGHAESALALSPVTVPPARPAAATTEKQAQLALF